MQPTPRISLREREEERVVNVIQLGCLPLIDR